MNKQLHLEQGGVDWLYRPAEDELIQEIARLRGFAEDPTEFPFWTPKERHEKNMSALAEAARLEEIVARREAAGTTRGRAAVSDGQRH